MSDVLILLGVLGLIMKFGHPGKTILALGILGTVWPVGLA